MFYAHEAPWSTLPCSGGFEMNEARALPLGRRERNVTWVGCRFIPREYVKTDP